MPKNPYILSLTNKEKPPIDNKVGSQIQQTYLFKITYLFLLGEDTLLTACTFLVDTLPFEIVVNCRQ